MQKTRKHLTREQRDQIRKLASDPTANLTNIAEKFQVHVSTITKYAPPRENSRGRKRMVSSNQVEKIITMLTNNIDAKRIAKKLKIHYSTVVRIISSLGTDLRDKFELTPSEKKSIAALYESDNSNFQIAEILGISVHRVTREIENLGPSKFFKIRNRREQIIKLYKSGKTQKEIADLFGIAQTGVSNYVRHLDIKNKKSTPRKKPVKITEQMREAMIKLYKQGRTQKEIAQVFGIKQATVSRNVNV